MEKMIVIVFEGTYDVFGPFTSKTEANDHLKKSGFIRVGKGYWANGDAYAHVKPVEPPRS